MPSIRRATPDDIQYCLRAAEEYTSERGYPYDEEHAREFILNVIQHGVVYVAQEEDGEVVGHSAAMITPDIYSPTPVGRVFTTWGKCGMSCFKIVCKILAIKGCKSIIADCPKGHRLTKVYNYLGFNHSYEFYTKDI